VPWRVDTQPPSTRWHAIGLAAFLMLLALYAAAGRYVAGPSVDRRLFWLLGSVGLAAVVIALVGRRRGWASRRVLLVGWPVTSLLVIIVTGLVEPAATQALPGTITLTFAYLGLTCPRWRSLALVPLGVAAYLIGGAKHLPEAIPVVIVTAVMWVLVAEVPAWLIARLEAQSALLRRIAETDALTQLLDRSTLAPQLSTHAGSSAVVVIDLDEFKAYNDQHGHEAGDALLMTFADSLRASISHRDKAFRIGGDEFLLLLADADRAHAASVVDRLRSLWTTAGMPVGFSAGIAAGEQDLMRLADEHMYANKRSRGLPAD